MWGSGLLSTDATKDAAGLLGDSGCEPPSNLTPHPTCPRSNSRGVLDRDAQSAEILRSIACCGCDRQTDDSEPDQNPCNLRIEWRQQSRKTGSITCVGLDPRKAQLPAPIRDAVRNDTDPEWAEAYRRFCCEIIDVVAGMVPCVKPQAAFFEALGPPGWWRWGT